MRTRPIADVPHLFRLWSDGTPTAQIAYELGTSASAIYQAAKQYGLPKRSRAKPQRIVDPTPEEIEERALAIKEKNLADMRAQP